MNFEFHSSSFPHKKNDKAGRFQISNFKQVTGFKTLVYLYTLIEHDMHNHFFKYTSIILSLNRYTFCDDEHQHHSILRIEFLGCPRILTATLWRNHRHLYRQLSDWCVKCGNTRILPFKFIWIDIVITDKLRKDGVCARVFSPSRCCPRAHSCALLFFTHKWQVLFDGINLSR